MGPGLMTADELLRLNLPDKRTELIRGRLHVREPGRVYRADGSESLLSASDSLDGEDLLPGFRCPLADLW